MKLTTLSRAIAGLCLLAFAAPAAAQVFNSAPDAFPTYKGHPAVPSMLVDSAGAANPTLSVNDTSLPTSNSSKYAGATVGTSSAQVIAAGTRLFLDLFNPSATATICINFGATATISAGVCSAGEITLPPLSNKTWEGSFVPSDAITAIASAASTPLTVGSN